MFLLRSWASGSSGSLAGRTRALTSATFGIASPDVVQVKHYMGSTWNDLKQAAKRELTRLKKLKPKPASYRFVTSQGLTPARKRVLKETLAP
jgi:hypothetical protein